MKIINLNIMNTASFAFRKLIIEIRMSKFIVRKFSLYTLYIMYSMYDLLWKGHNPSVHILLCKFVSKNSILWTLLEIKSVLQ